MISDSRDHGEKHEEQNGYQQPNREFTDTVSICIRMQSNEHKIHTKEGEKNGWISPEGHHIK